MAEAGAGGLSEEDLVADLVERFEVEGATTMQLLSDPVSLARVTRHEVASRINRVRRETAEWAGSPAGDLIHVLHATHVASSIDSQGEHLSDLALGELAASGGPSNPGARVGHLALRQILDTPEGRAALRNNEGFIAVDGLAGFAGFAAREKSGEDRAAWEAGAELLAKIAANQKTEAEPLLRTMAATFKRALTDPATLTVAVSPAMCEFLASAAPAFPSDTPFSAAEAPSKSGVILFANPLMVEMDDASFREMLNELNQWMNQPAKVEEYLELQQKARDRRPWIHGLWWETLGGGDDAEGMTVIFGVLMKPGTLHWEWNHWERPITDRWVSSRNVLFPCSSSVTVVGKIAGETHVMRFMQDDGNWDESSSLSLLRSVWALGREDSFIDSTEIRPAGLPSGSKKAKRRAKSQGPVSSHTVTVLDLKQSGSSGGFGENGTGNFSCRWLVRGHWRRQPYRSTGEVRLRYIAPYVKGPDGAPLKDSAAKVWVA